MADDDPHAAFRESARESLLRMQEVEPEALPRVDELGRELNFGDAVPPARRLRDLYAQLDERVLEALPEAALRQIEQRANADYSVIQQIRDFAAASENPAERRNGLITKLRQVYEPTFASLHPWISYSVRKSTDFQRLEDEARALIQKLRDDMEKLRRDMQKDKEDAQATLESIRKVAEEQGVSQQAIYFKNAGDEHGKDATRWFVWTIVVSVVLAVYAFATLWLHKWPTLAPENAYQTVQLVASKVLIFAVISYVLYLCARNFLAHRHNAIVNQHRQNALTTYEALVRAAGTEANRDIVLGHASSCIFAPQPTGFAKEPSDGSPGGQFLGLLSSVVKTPPEG